MGVKRNPGVVAVVVDPLDAAALATPGVFESAGPTGLISLTGKRKSMAWRCKLAAELLGKLPGPAKAGEQSIGAVGVGCGCGTGRVRCRVKLRMFVARPDPRFFPIRLRLLLASLGIIVVVVLTMHAG